MAIECGADVNARNNQKCNPIMLAARAPRRPTQDTTIFELLLNAGSNVLLRDKDGLTALHLARESARDGESKFVARSDGESDAVVQLLQDAYDQQEAIERQRQAAITLKVFGPRLSWSRDWSDVIGPGK